MKLSKLYSNKTFKSINFNDGLNVVLAKVTKKADLNKSSHNLGKTTLITVIDFMLLKELTDSHIFQKFNDKFTGYVFYLEIILNNGKYLTIKRSVNANTKISFKLNDTSTDCLNVTSWDFVDVSIKRAKEQLNEFLAFDVLPNWDYRKSLTYFLRSQKDYNDVFQLDKFKAGKHIYWKPFMFDLLGFNGTLLNDKYILDDEIDVQKDFIKKIKKQYSVDEEEVDKIKGTIELKKIEQAQLQKEIDNFSFYNQERLLNKELVEDIEKAIADLNTEEYNLQYEYEKTKESIKNKTSFDIDQLKIIYSEAEIFFPDNLSKDYESLVEFNKEITEERNKYLAEQLANISKHLEKVRTDLKTYDEKRNSLLSFLKDKDSFKKFKAFQIDLTKIEVDITKLVDKLSSIDRIATLNEQTEDLKEKLEKLVKEISTHIRSNDNVIFPQIKILFNNIFRYIFNTPALIYIVPNSQGNIEFKVEVTKENEIDITAESQGNSFEKMLCISFDIALLIAYSKHSFYRFVYHDGSLEGLDNRKKANYITLLKSHCKEHNIQYIFTSIQDDIPTEILNQLSSKEICLTLDDSGDSGKLFGFSF
jgi:uncharacterized protein YydD (DUF2326 family)